MIAKTCFLAESVLWRSGFVPRLLAIIFCAGLSLELGNLPVSAGERRFRIFLIALDGADWGPIHKLVQENRLPNLQALMRDGSYGILKSTQPSLSPALWTTLITGMRHEEHGIHDFFTNREQHQINGQPLHSATSRQRRKKALWNILSEAGYTCGVVGFMNTWPVEKIHGIMLADTAVYSKDLKKAVYPAGAMKKYGRFPAWAPYASEEKQVLKRFTSFDLDPDWKSLDEQDTMRQYHDLVDGRLRLPVWRDESFARFSEALLTADPVEFFVLYLCETDFVSHGFWKYSNYATDLRGEEQGRAFFGNVIDRAYEHVDEIIGRLLRFTDERTVVMVVSDHGMEGLPKDVPDYRKTLISGGHRLEGIFIFSGSPFKTGESTASVTLFDIAPTILSLYGLPVAEDMSGHALTELLREDYAVGHPLRRIKTYEKGRPVRLRDSTVLPSSEELDRLRGLGYIR